MRLESAVHLEERAPETGVDPFEDAPPGYRIVERVFAGSRAALYRAVRREDGKNVLLKTARHRRATPRDLADFAHEHTVLSRLTGAPIVAALAFETEQCRPWLVLDDVGGQSLDRMMSRFRTPERSLTIAVCIADALAEVHRRGVVHRDVKPEHVMVLPDDSVRLTGFRLASLLRVDGSTASVEGSLAYMAPEQTGRMNRPVDKRADLYAVGVVLYELLTGRRPFEGADPLEWIHAHIAKAPVPPEKVDAGVPRSASAIVLKLLSKHAEDRYHGATGLRRDLARCLERVKRGDGAFFPLATDDAPEQLCLSHRLIGREKEVAQLVSGFERARTDGSCVVSLVAGYSGVGKTSVVGALYQPIVRERGRFVGGKFDQYKRDIPYATLVQAFRDLMRDILAAGEAPLAIWRERLRAALGINGRVIADVISEIELVVGPQPPVPALAPAEAQNRFEAVLLAFVRVFARSDHPLVVFLDDLQWADGATLGVLKLLARPGEVPCLQLVLAYRDNEVDDRHPFHACIEAMRATGAAVDLVPIRELRPEDVTQLLADTLLRRIDDTELATLSALVCSKAGGNPFFVSELLQAFDARGLFAFDVELGGWTWDAAAMHAAEVTDNVVDLLAQRLRSLPEQTRRALELASCFGSRFRLATLASVLGLGVDDASAALFIALDEGLIVQIDDAPGGDRAYRFHHDRIQQAAYSLLDDAARAETHLHIGRLLRGGLETGGGELLFDVVKHLDQASFLIVDAGERAQLVELNLGAGRRAKAAIAWEPARLYLESALGLLPAESWTAAYSTTFEVMRELAECEFLTGHFARAELRFDELRRRAASLAERAGIATLQVRLYVLTSRYDQALALGTSELAFFGESFPADDADAGDAILEERQRLTALLGERDVRAIVDLPLTVDEEKRALITLLASLPPVIYSRRPAIFPLVAMRTVNLSLEHGNCEASCFGYSMVAMLFAAAAGDADLALALSEASIALNERLRDPKLRGSVLHVHANHIVYWKRPYLEASALLQRAYSACMDVGDLTIAAYVTFMGAWLSLEHGHSLEAASSELRLLEELARATRHETARDAVAIQRQFVRALSGHTDGPTSLSSDGFDADANRARIEAAGLDTAVAMHDVLRAMLAYHHGLVIEADAWLTRAAKRLPAAFCLPLETTWSFFDALTAAELCTGADGDARGALLARIANAEDRLRRAALSCPANFDAKHALVVAERARLEGKTLDALRGYEEAARAARRAGLLSVEALAMQVAARFLLANRLEREARGWLADYADVLRQWGAHSLLRAFEAAHPELRRDADAEPYDPDTYQGPPEQFDALVAVKVSQALSREFTVEGVTQTLLQSVLQNAGAERAVLLLTRDGQLEVVAASGLDADGRLTAQTPEDLPDSIVRYVERTRSAVVLANAPADHAFARDPYFLRVSALSVLCLPVVIRAQLVGVLYLENSLVTGAFSSTRLTLLEAICTQLAISLENAQLYREREGRATEAARNAGREAQRIDLYRHFMEASFVIAVLRGPEHRIELANPQALAHWGRTADVVGLPLATALPEIHGQPFLGYLDEVFRTGVPYHGQGEYARLPLGPGGALEDGYYNFVYAPLRGQDGTVEGILLTGFDVTAQVVARNESEKSAALLRDAKAELQVIADRFETAQRAANIGIFDFDFDSSEAYWSPELYSLLGVPAGGISPSIDEWSTHTMEADRGLAAAAFEVASAAQRETYELELRLKQPSGGSRAVRLSNRIFYAKGRPTRLVGAAVDIEALRRAAELERAARAVAERHARFHEMFSGMLGHDLRNPLSAIVTSAALITRPNATPDAVARSAARILSSGRRMARMIDQLLDFTRIRAGGGIPLMLEPGDLARLCARTRDEIEAALPDAKIEIEEKGEPGAEVDEDRLLQVLSNLVGNAAVHGDKDSPVRILIDGSSEAEVLVSIWNSGVIPTALMPALFEPFRGGKTKSKGLGLGLYITQQIVHAHRGTVGAQSSATQGTMFELRLPRHHRGDEGAVDA